MTNAIVFHLENAWNHRIDHVNSQHLEAFRWVHGIADGLPGLFIDIYLNKIMVVIEDPAWSQHREFFEKKLPHCSKRHPPLIWVENFRGKPPQVLSSERLVKIVKEQGCLFEVRLGEGSHTGLFLDQRDNRLWIQKHAAHRRVLNLFSYTGSFSVAAFKGGASEIVSVDLSSKALQGLARNAELNKIPSDRCKIFKQDVFDFINRAHRKNEKFDLIILDPPSFAHSKKRSFSTRDDFSDLMAQVLALLSSEGNLLASMNTQSLSFDTFLFQIQTVLSSTGFEIQKRLGLPFDFPVLKKEQKNPYLKVVWIGPKK